MMWSGFKCITWAFNFENYEIFCEKLFNVG